MPSSSPEGNGRPKQELDGAQVELRLYQLKWIKSDAVVQSIRTLFDPDSKVRFEADERTNAIVARGTADELSTLGKLLELLDREPTSK